MYKNKLAALLCTPLWLSAALFPVASIAGEITNVGQRSANILVFSNYNSHDWSFTITAAQELWGDMMKDEEVASITAITSNINADMAFRFPDAPQQKSSEGGLDAVLTEMGEGKNKMTVRLVSQDKGEEKQDSKGNTWLVIHRGGARYLSVLKDDDIPVGPGDYHLTVEGAGWTE